MKKIGLANDRRVVLTRAEAQAETLARCLRAVGAEIAPLPLLEIIPPPDPAPLATAAANLDSFAWLAFSSTNAVHAFLAENPTLVRGSPSIAALGPGTAQALRDRGHVADLVSAQGHAAGLAAELATRVTAGQRVLVPQAADARPDLVTGLREAGLQVLAVAAYDKALPTAAQAQAKALFAHNPLGWVTFTSPRIVRHFAGLFEADWPGRRAELRALSIGPTTSAELRHQGVEPSAEATTPTPEAMASAWKRALLIQGSRQIICPDDKLPRS